MKPVLVIGGLVVAGVAIAIWLMIGRDPTSATDPEPGSAGSAGSQVVPATRDDGRPSLPVVTATERGTTPRVESPVTEYVVGDKRIRDHRGGNRPPLDIPPNSLPAEGRRIKPELTGSISNKVQAVMAECKANVPPEALGTSPRLEGQVTIAIKDKQAAITKAVIKLRDVVGASLEATEQCISQKSVGLSTSAGDEADLESYTITLSYAFR